jgi:hypothetical protein
MNTHCQPLPSQVAEELLQIVTRAICDRPADSGPQRESRTRQMIHSVLGFEPRDGLEYMLATIAFGHFQLILASMRDVFQGQSDAMKAKTTTTIVALDRMMLEMIKQLSLVRRRPMAYSGMGTAEAAREAPSQPTAASPVDDAAAAEPIDVGVVLEEAAAARSAPSMPAKSAMIRSGPEDIRSAAAPPNADMAQVGAARVDPVLPDGTPPGFAAFARTMLALTGVGVDEHGQGTAASTASSAPSPDTADEDAGTFEDHIAAFEDAYAATMEVLAEARALELEKAEAASGDQSGFRSG